MTIEEAKSRIEKYREGCKAKDGKVVVFSDTGPAGMGMIDLLFEAIQTQAERIDELERQIAAMKNAPLQ